MDAVSVTGRDIRAESEVLLVAVGVVKVPHRFKNFGDVVDDESVAAGEHLAADGVNLPPGDVEVQPIKECRVMVTLGQFVKQV